MSDIGSATCVTPIKISAVLPAVGVPTRPTTKVLLMVPWKQVQELREQMGTPFIIELELDHYLHDRHQRLIGGERFLAAHQRSRR